MKSLCFMLSLCLTSYVIAEDMTDKNEGANALITCEDADIAKIEDNVYEENQEEMDKLITETEAEEIISQKDGFMAVAPDQEINSEKQNHDQEEKAILEGESHILSDDFDE